MREPQRESADEINEAELPVFRASLVLVDRPGEPVAADRTFPCVIANNLVRCRPASENGRNDRLEAEPIYINQIVSSGGAPDSEGGRDNAKWPELSATDPPY